MAVISLGFLIILTEVLKEEIRDAMRENRKTQFGGWLWAETEVVHSRDKGRFALHSNGIEEVK